MSTRTPRRRDGAPRRKTVTVPLPVLLDLDDELSELADLLRLATDLSRAIGRADASTDRISRVAEQLGVQPEQLVANHADAPASHLDQAALTDLGTAPATILAIALERLYRLRALVGVARDRGRSRARAGRVAAGAGREGDGGVGEAAPGVACPEAISHLNAPDSKEAEPVATIRPPVNWHGGKHDLA